VSVALVPAFGFAQAKQQPTSESVAQAQALYFQLDYVGGTSVTTAALAKGPAGPELRAWNVIHLARSGQPIQAKAAAAALAKSDPNSPWTSIAAAAVGAWGTPSDSKAGLAALVEAGKRAPNDPAVRAARIIVYHGLNKYDEVVALVDSAAASQQTTHELQAIRAYARWGTAFGKKALATRVDSAIGDLRTLFEANPSSAYVAYMYGQMLSRANKSDEAYRVLKRAAELSPLSPAIHSAYWEEASGQKNVSAEAKSAEILADIDQLLAKRGDAPSVLSVVISRYGDLKLADKKLALEQKLLNQFPTSVQAERVLSNRVMDAQRLAFDTSNHDPEAKAKFKRAAQEFISRPTHIDTPQLGFIYMILAETADSTMPNQEFLALVRGATKYEEWNPHITFGMLPLKLADRKIALAEAESLVRKGMKVSRAKTESMRRVYETEGDFARALDQGEASGYDALGWIRFNAGRYDEAVKYLKQSRELNSETNYTYQSAYHLGRTYEAMKKLDLAEEAYIQGAMAHPPGPNPNHAALKSLYVARKGSLEGYDAYAANLVEIDRANRKKKIESERAVKATDLEPFRLSDLQGNTVPIDSLKGKTAVINFWGVWCGWCVKEMPDYQELAKKYAGDKDVLILTINNDKNPDEAREWMKKKGFDFNVLLDDGYVTKVGIHAFPTTWFVAPDGKISFTKVGWTEKLVEEFGWRVELLRPVSKATP
jgi:tetratricopeptide (TPR) repeat protein